MNVLKAIAIMFGVLSLKLAHADTITTQLQGFNQLTYASFLSESGSTQIGDTAATMNTSLNGIFAPEGGRGLFLKEGVGGANDRSGISTVYHDLLVGDEFRILYNPIRLEGFTPTPTVRDGYTISGTPINNNGIPVGSTVILASGTSDPQSNINWSEALLVMTLNANLRVDVEIFHISGIHTPGKGFRFGIDQATLTRTSAPVPLPASFELLLGACTLVVIRRVRRPNV